MQKPSRNKTYQKAEPSKEAKKLYIFCEGSKTEYLYFNYFRGLSSNIDIIPEKPIDGRSAPDKLMEQARSGEAGMRLEAEYHDEVWFAIDTDHWNEGNKIGELRDFCEEQSKTGIDWQVAQSNPCFEIWQYYHKYNAKPESDSVEKCETFKQFVHQCFDGRGFKVSEQAYLLDQAVKNAEANYESDCGQPALYSTEAYLLGKKILVFVKDLIVKAESRK